MRTTKPASLGCWSDDLVPAPHQKLRQVAPVARSRQAGCDRDSGRGASVDRHREQARREAHGLSVRVPSPDLGEARNCAEDVVLSDQPCHRAIAHRSHLAVLVNDVDLTVYDENCGRALWKCTRCHRRPREIISES